MNDKSREQVVKDALSSSTRAISQKKELEITFGMDSLSGNSIPKVSSSKKDLIASRGKADKIALKEKYSFEKPNKITGIQELDQILFEQNDIRLDILGSLQFAGVKKNLHKNFLDSLESFAPETAYENTSKALQIWLKKNLLDISLTEKEKALIEPFKKDLSALERKYIPKVKEALDEKEDYLNQIQLILEELEISFDEEDSYTIQQILKNFKYHSSPGVSSENHRLLYPSQFRMKFYRWVNNRAIENEWLPKIEPCVLTSVEVNYAASDGWAVHHNGAPADIDLTLSFKELTPVFREHYATRARGVY